MRIARRNSGKNLYKINLVDIRMNVRSTRFRYKIEVWRGVLVERVNVINLPECHRSLNRDAWEIWTYQD